jgi:hypothetical protein
MMQTNIRLVQCGQSINQSINQSMETYIFPIDRQGFQSFL